MWRIKFSGSNFGISGKNFLEFNKKYRNLSDDKLTQASFYTNFGVEYANLEEYDKAESLFLKSIEILESFEDRDTTTINLRIASIYYELVNLW